MHAEELEIEYAIGRNGEAFVRDGMNVMTHCNAGGLATAGYGTALGVLYAAWERGKRFHVYVDETRPLLQGARLTAWELGKRGIPHTLLCEGAAASLFAAGRVDAVHGRRRPDRRERRHGEQDRHLRSRRALREVRQAALRRGALVDVRSRRGVRQGDPDRGAPVRPRWCLRRSEDGARGHAAYNPAFDVTPPH